MRDPDIAKVIRESFFPDTGRQINGLAGRMLADTLEDIDEIGIRVDTLQLARHQQALDDIDLFGAQFTPAEQPVPAVMESFP